MYNVQYIYILLGTTSSINTVSLISDDINTTDIMTSIEPTIGISNSKLNISVKLHWLFFGISRKNIFDISCSYIDMCDSMCYFFSDICDSDSMCYCLGEEEEETFYNTQWRYVELLMTIHLLYNSTNSGSRSTLS